MKKSAGEMAKVVLGVKEASRSVLSRGLMSKGLLVSGVGGAGVLSGRLLPRGSDKAEKSKKKSSKKIAELVLDKLAYSASMQAELNNPKYNILGGGAPASPPPAFVSPFSAPTAGAGFAPLSGSGSPLITLPGANSAGIIPGVSSENKVIGPSDPRVKSVMNRGVDLGNTPMSKADIQEIAKASARKRKGPGSNPKVDTAVASEQQRVQQAMSAAKAQSPEAQIAKATNETPEKRVQQALQETPEKRMQQAAAESKVTQTASAEMRQPKPMIDAKPEKPFIPAYARKGFMETAKGMLPKTRIGKGLLGAGLGAAGMLGGYGMYRGLRDEPQPAAR
jgi:hypothetical protein